MALLQVGHRFLERYDPTLRPGGLEADRPALDARVALPVADLLARAVRDMVRAPAGSPTIRASLMWDRTREGEIRHEGPSRPLLEVGPNLKPLAHPTLC